MYLKNRILKQFREITQHSHPGLFRPHSKPFLTGDTLRKYSDHIFDETGTFNPKRVNKKDIVFLKTDLLDIYFNYYHQKISKEYILITHNSDLPIDDLNFKYIDEKINHWFATNLTIDSNDLISPIPIGLENRRFLSFGRIKNFKKVQNLKNQKENLIACSFSQHTNPLVRKGLIESVKHLSHVNTFSSKTQFEYLNNLSKHSFNLCPEGNGVETHRFWESLALNVIPICTKSRNNMNYLKLGIPMLMIDDWSDFLVYELSEFKKISAQFNDIDISKYTSFNFWWNRIMNKKNKL